MDIVTVKTRQPQLGCAHGREAGGFSGNELVLPRQKGEKQRPLVFAGAPKPLGGRAYTTPPSLWQTDELDLEIWPTCIVIPPGHRLAFTIQAHDLERETAPGTLGMLGTFRGSGPFVHTDPWDWRPERVGGNVNIYGGGDRGSYLLLPIIPMEVRNGSDVAG